MAIFKCKMCGGNLEVTEGAKVVKCDYCDTNQTVPNGDDEKKTNLFNRANDQRVACEFDRAAGVYETIVAEFPKEAEGYWGLCLCEYGIEYVDDPQTGKKIPTCHRTSTVSIFESSNYKSARDYADPVAKTFYQAEAKAIDDIQKGILKIANKEEPFDIFICYKETDDSGNRTPDSVLAQDLYDELTERGYKVFFSRITLEDKLGQEYEPYIFAALSSARVMLAVGTKREYYDAVWVKNEWSRYLSLMQKDRKKTLIPCYRDMDAYDMPAEFKNLQGQDMGRLGFVQDLVRGIDKLIPKKAKEVLSTPETDVYLREVKNLIKRGNVCLEDKNYENAAKFFEQALNKNVEEPQAHLGKLLSDLRIPNEKSLSSVSGRLDQYESYRSAYRFGDKELQKRLDNYNTQAKYRFSSVLMDRVTSYEDCVNVEKLLEEISGYKDVDEKKKLCHEMKNSYLYQRAIGIMQSANTPEEYEQAQKIFHQISGYKESDQYLLECGKKVKLTSGFANRIRLKLLEKGRDFGTVSLINSIIGLLCCVIPIFAVLAIAFGVLSRKFEENSRVKASIGIVLGVLEILFFIINFISGFAIL